jgi:hypothetical protein
MARTGDFVQVILEAWDRSVISFAVLRDYEGAAERGGLEVLVAERDRSERVLLDATKNSGGACTTECNSLGLRCSYLTPSERRRYVSISSIGLSGADARSSLHRRSCAAEFSGTLSGYLSRFTKRGSTW